MYMKNAITIEESKLTIKKHIEKFVNACKKYDSEYEVHVAIWETDMWNEYKSWDVTVDYYEKSELVESWTWKNLDSCNMDEELDEKARKELLKACRDLGAYLGKNFNSSLGTVKTYTDIQTA